MRSLSSPMPDLRRRILELAVDMTTEKNVEKVSPHSHPIPSLPHGGEVVALTVVQKIS